MFIWLKLLLKIKVFIGIDDSLGNQNCFFYWQSCENTLFERLFLSVYNTCPFISPFAFPSDRKCTCIICLECRYECIYRCWHCVLCGEEYMSAILGICAVRVKIQLSWGMFIGKHCCEIPAPSIASLKKHVNERQKGNFCILLVKTWCWL